MCACVCVLRLLVFCSTSYNVHVCTFNLVSTSVNQSFWFVVDDTAQLINLHKIFSFAKT